jgi:hypothetical protein
MEVYKGLVWGQTTDKGVIGFIKIDIKKLVYGNIGIHYGCSCDGNN